MGFKSRNHGQTIYYGRKTTRRIWVPAVPAWEKEFCLKNGEFTWENFLECKRYTYHFEKILEWNDSAAEEAFNYAKNRFNAEFHNLKFVDTNFEPNPNLYIDEIDWNNSEIDPQLLLELELALKAADEEDDGINIPKHLRRTYEMPIEKIVPTGWDVVDFVECNILTGLIVGDHSSCGEGAEVSRRPCRRTG
ncbi:uncharacterized protein LOC142164115 [Nicotiana tabacum]|uniref:Uncharacterized protein LOC142164115 n=1 Tax=Nicotiana tabacum TaxID=4097 RepID=A0AC58RXD0_TOBAC|nr:uncharacterized protein LOC117274366 [Nicotiana tomentosiformis]